jgi:hypothetical protein
MPGAHSKIGASSAYRWMACPGSVRESRGLESATSVYAAEGTVAHHVAEQALEQGLPAHSFVGEIFDEDGHQIEVTEEMTTAVDVYLDYVRDILMSHDDAVLHVERSFRLKQLHPAAFGTADGCIWIPSTGELYVLDYKHGAGVPVEIEDNKQARYYGCGALLDLGYTPDKVVLGIIQPRCPHPDGPIRTTEIHPMDLIDFMGTLKAAMDATEDPDAPLVPGDHCHWCPAAGKPCPALAKLATDTAQREFRPDLSYDPEELADTLAKLPVIEKWCKSVREFAYEQKEHGKPVPGWKLVEKRATRRWRDEAAAVQALLAYGLDEDQIYKPKALKTPPQIEKVVGKAGKDDIVDLWVAESSGHTLVPESDKRPAVKASAQEDFS